MFCLWKIVFAVPAPPRNWDAGDCCGAMLIFVSAGAAWEVRQSLTDRRISFPGVTGREQPVSLKNSAWTTDISHKERETRDCLSDIKMHGSKLHQAVWRACKTWCKKEKSGENHLFSNWMRASAFVFLLLLLNIFIPLGLNNQINLFNISNGLILYTYAYFICP